MEDKKKEVEEAKNKMKYILEVQKKLGINYALETEDENYISTLLNYIQELELQNNQLAEYLEDEFYVPDYEVKEKYISKLKIKEYINKIQKELDKRKVKGMYIALEGKITDTDINTWIIQRATLEELLEESN